MPKPFTAKAVTIRYLLEFCSVAGLELGRRPVGSENERRESGHPTPAQAGLGLSPAPPSGLPHLPTANLLL